MNITEFFEKYPKVAIAFSGGVDSSYLLYAAKQSGAQVHAYYVQSDFQPDFEKHDAKRLASELGVEMTVLELDALQDATVAANPQNRCYYCKKHIFGSIIRQAEQDGFHILLDGTNASDEVSDRPGMAALRELSVLSPLRECGITKEQVRQLSRDAGLFTWDKPSYACLATRIPTGDIITKEKLQTTEWAENYLFSLGFTDFRVRFFKNSARLQFPANQIDQAMKLRKQIVQVLKSRYDNVLLDMEARNE